MDIKEIIKEALENNQLESQMSVIRMEAVKQNINEDTLRQMIETEKNAFEMKKQQEEDVKQRVAEMRKREEEIQRKAVEAAKRNKYILWGVSAVLIILEWILIFNAHPAEGEESHFILTLIVNFITLLAVVIGAAVFFRKHN